MFCEYKRQTFTSMPRPSTSVLLTEDNVVQAAAYEELVRVLSEPRAAGERGGRALLAGALPRLAQLEGAPVGLVTALLQLAHAGDDRCGALC